MIYRNINQRCYSCPEGSEHDIFNVEHKSTSASLACELVKACDLAGGTENIIAIIGDVSLIGDEAMEGLDFAWELHSNFYCCSKLQRNVYCKKSMAACMKI